MTTIHDMAYRFHDMIIALRVRRLMACPQHLRCFAALMTLEACLVAGAGVVQGPGRLVWTWAVGLGGWSLAEYLLHRFVFHIPAEHPLAGLGARLHHEHHRQPDALPITKPLRLTLPVLVAMAAAAILVAPGSLGLVAGFVAGYFLYEVAHVAAHVLGDAHPLPGLQAAHLGHHRYRVDRAFGITSPLWDRVFSTRPAVRIAEGEDTGRQAPK
jgi:sterol desaturase/sphingolipid hydroxylase (fatty acid hydroxylase superfamily)